MWKILTTEFPQNILQVALYNFKEATKNVLLNIKKYKSNVKER